MPHLLRAILARLRALVRRDTVAGEIHDELNFHLQMRIEEYERRGLSHHDARRLANDRVGNLAVHQDRGYDVRGGGVLETVWQDVKYALRILRRQPGFAATALLTLSLGIGASTAIFSVVDAAVLRPLPYAASDRLFGVMVTSDDGGEPQSTSPSPADVRDISEAKDTVSSAGFWIPFAERELVDSGAGPERVETREAADTFFTTLGIRPALGRTFDEGDLRRGAPRVALLGYGFWRSRFGSDPNVVNKTYASNRGPVRIVGVLPPNFYRDTAIWKPVSPTHDRWSVSRGSGSVTYVRLRPGVDRDQAERALATRLIAGSLARGDSSVRGVTLKSLHSLTTEDARPTVAILAGAVGCVLLIACVNVAGLLFARGSARHVEFSVRRSLGAGRARLVRQLLTEGAVLAAGGGCLGALIAMTSLRGLLAILPLTLPGDTPATINGRVLLFAAGLSAASVLLFALLPALRLSRATNAPSPVRRAHWLIAAETALAIVLLAGGGLMIGSFAKATRVNLGYDPSPVLFVDAEPLSQSAAARAQYYQNVLRKLGSLNGLAAYGAADFGPLGEMSVFGFARVDREEGVTFRQVSAGFAQALGLRLIEGRWPEAAANGKAASAVLNQEAVRRLVGDGPAIGRVLVANGTAHVIAGVVSDIRQSPLSPPESEVLLPLNSVNIQFSTMTIPALSIAVRPAAGTTLSADVLRDVVRSVDTRAFVEVRNGSALFQDRIATERQRAWLFGLFGAIGVALTLVGIFGITAYTVARRTTELGIRLALGAAPSRLVADLLVELGRPIVAGLVVGLGATLLAGRAISSFLYDTKPTDPLVLSSVVASLAAAALLAAWWPARRVTRVDPVAALREQ